MTINIIQFNSARLRARHSSDNRLFSHVVLSARRPDMPGTKIPCTIANLSVGSGY